jgi:hypothetical protein
LRLLVGEIKNDMKWWHGIGRQLAISENYFSSRQQLSFFFIWYLLFIRNETITRETNSSLNIRDRPSIDSEEAIGELVQVCEMLRS